MKKDKVEVQCYYKNIINVKKNDLCMSYIK